jgi:hypothetical protein
MIRILAPLMAIACVMAMAGCPQPNSGGGSNVDDSVGDGVSGDLDLIGGTLPDVNDNFGGIIIDIVNDFGGGVSEDEDDSPETAAPEGSPCGQVAIACYDELARQPASLICFREQSRWPAMDLTWAIEFFDCIIPRASDLRIDAHASPKPSGSKPEFASRASWLRCPFWNRPPGTWPSTTSRAERERRETRCPLSARFDDDNPGIPQGLAWATTIRDGVRSRGR